MPESVNIDAVAKAIAEGGFDTVPELTGNSQSILVQILQKAPNKWIGTDFMRTVYGNLGYDTKYLANAMHKLKGVNGIEHAKRGRYNFYRFVQQ